MRALPGFVKPAGHPLRVRTRPHKLLVTSSPDRRLSNFTATRPGLKGRPPAVGDIDRFQGTRQFTRTVLVAACGIRHKAGAGVDGAATGIDDQTITKGTAGMPVSSVPCEMGFRQIPPAFFGCDGHFLRFPLIVSAHSRPQAGPFSGRIRFEKLPCPRCSSTRLTLLPVCNRQWRRVRLLDLLRSSPACRADSSARPDKRSRATCPGPGRRLPRSARTVGFFSR